jgi:hypothetical protein
MTSGRIRPALFGTRQRNPAKPNQKPNKSVQGDSKMTKQLIALAIAAAFGVAHAADVKPAAEPKPAAAPTAAVVKAEVPKAEVKAPEVKPAAAAPEVKAEAKPADNQHVKKVKHAPATTPEVHSADAAKAVEPVKK